MTYEDTLREKLSKTRSPVTVGQYIKRLQVLNNNKKLKNLSFLVDYDGIMKKIEELNLAFSTQTSYLTAISATLSLFPKYKKLYKRYQEQMIKNAKIISGELDKNEKNEKQKDSIVPLNDVIAVREKAREDFENATAISSKEWNKLLEYLLLSLYTMIAPRRNKDFLKMVVVMERPEEMNNENNYYVIDEGKFIFNNYKTKKQYGSQEIIIPEDLKAVLNMYLEYYLQISDSTSDEIPLLINFNGKAFTQQNAITRILNRAFDGKHIGSSALRHIFLSDKFGDTLKKQKEIAESMAHSTNTAKNYTKID